MSMTFDTETLDQITFPLASNWIPDTHAWFVAARQLLRICGGALDLYARGDDYKVRHITHGNEIVWDVVNHAQDRQLFVAIAEVYPGRAGERQFKFAQGALGQVMSRVVSCMVQICGPWPTVRSGLAPGISDDDAFNAASDALLNDARIVDSALWAATLGGVTPGPCPIPQDNMIISGMTPKGPVGGLAGWQWNVELQFP
jgi:hypothetical protein